MRNKPTEAQIKEFWEWCGYNWVTYAMGEVPSLDLNNLFKYAVPKITDYTLGKHFPGGCYAEVYKDTKYHRGYSIDKDPALALFWAIWGVFHD